MASPPGKEETSYKGLQMSSFPAITVKAISELRAGKDAQIDALKEANSALKSRLDRLEALLEERRGRALGRALAWNHHRSGSRM